MSLYDINQELLNLTDPDTGEIADYELFEQLQITRHEKLENIGLWIKNLRAEAEAFKKEKEAFTEKQKQAEKKAENLKNYLSTALDGKKFKTTKLEVSYRKSTSVNIPDIERLDSYWLKQTVTYTPEKAEIGKALKAGIEVEGAELVETNNIQIK